MKRDLRDKVIVITGASSGIGAATALACAAAGMHVALNARRKDKLEVLAERIRQCGRRALVVAGDVDRDEQVQELVDKTVGEFGRLDAAFANAGYGLYTSIADSSNRQARDIFETNFFGTLRLIRAAIPVMRRQGHGHLLICSSAVSEIGLPMYGLYCATKAAQDAVASAMRAELSFEGIDVSSVHPVGTQSEFYDAVIVRSECDRVAFNTPAALTQTSERVARDIVKCLRRPRAEVWPNPWARLGLALVTAFPALNASSMRSLMRKRFPTAVGDGAAARSSPT